MAILSTNKIQGVLQTEHRKAKGKTENIFGSSLYITGLIMNRKFQQKVPTEIPIPYCIHLWACVSIIIYYYYYYHHHHHCLLYARYPYTYSRDKLCP